MIFSCLGEYIRDIYSFFKRTAVLNLKNDEEYTYRQFIQAVAVKNGKNAIILSVAGIAMIIVFMILRLIADVRINLTSDILDIISYALLFLTFIASLLLNRRELIDRQPDFKMLKILFYAFWSAFTVAFALLTISDIISYQTTSAYYLQLISLLLFAEFTFGELLVFGSVPHLTLIIAYIIRGYGMSDIIMVLILFTAFIIISSSNSTRFAEAWLGNKNLSTANERCRQMAEKDLFTGLLNKSGLLKKMKNLTLCGFSEDTYTVILVDIDNFRQFGILYGDEQVNSCLYSVCNCIRIISKSKTDIISRFGEDDFVIVLQNSNEYDMISFAEQLRESIETMAVPFGDSIVTVTLGVSAIGKLSSDNAFSVMLQEADNQLVHAKKNGKNCIGYKNRIFRKE